MNNVEQILETFGERVTRLAKINIGATRTVNGKKRRIEYTGKLRESLDYDVKENPNSIEFSISMEDYGVGVDQGQKPGTLASLSKLREWIRKKPARLRDSQGRFVKMSNKQVANFAEFIQYKINQYGTQPTNFLTEPFEAEFKKLPDELIEAYGLDVEELLNQSLRNGN